MTLLFSIDADTGLLTTDANLADGALDYEEQRDYEVIVTVSDGVENGDLLAGEADDELRVIIRLTDDTADNDAVVNRETVLQLENEGDGLLTTRTVAENLADEEHRQCVGCYR